MAPVRGWLTAALWGLAELAGGVLAGGLGAERFAAREACTRALAWLDGRAGPLECVERACLCPDPEVAARARGVVGAWFARPASAFPDIRWLPRSPLRLERIAFYEAMGGAGAGWECRATRWLVLDMAEAGRARQARELVRKMGRERARGR